MLILTSLPAFQKWGAGVASQLLEDKIKSKVSIGNVRMNLLGRVVLDNVHLYDRRDTLMLRASRIAAKVDFMPLIERKIRISGAQLIGAKAKIYKDGDEPFNFQFIVDAFSKKDTTSSPLDLAIGALVVRRGEVRFDKTLSSSPLRGESKGENASRQDVTLLRGDLDGSFDPHHLHVRNLSLTARVHFIKPDSLSLDLRNLSFTEQSGLKLKHLSLDAEVGKTVATVRDLKVELPNTIVKSEELRVKNKSNNFSAVAYDKGANDNSSLFTLHSSLIEGSLCPRDLSCFVPKLATFHDIINLSAEVHLSDGTLRLPNISVSDNHGNLSLLCDATIQDVWNAPAIFADIKELRTGAALQQFLTENLQGLLSPGPSKGGGKGHGSSPLHWSGWERLGSTKTSGSIAWQNKRLQTNLQTESEQGSVAIEGTLQDMQEIDAKVAATDLQLGNLLNLPGERKNTTLSVETTISGSLPGKGRQPKLAATGVLNSLTFNGYEHRNIPFTAALDGESISGEVNVDEPNGKAMVIGQSSMANGKRTLTCQAQLENFAPHKMGLTKKYEGERFSGTLDANLDDIDLNNLQGKLILSDLEIDSEDKGTLRIGDVELESSRSESGQHLVLQSDFLNIKADGNVNWKTLPASFSHPVKQNLPSLFATSESRRQPEGNDFRFLVQVQDTVLADRLLGTSLLLPAQSTLEGTIRDAIGQIALQMHIPRLEFAGQELQNIECRAESNAAAIQASLQGERLIKGKPVDINLDAYAKDDKVTSRLRWDNKGTIANTGDISLTGNVRRDLADKPAIDARINKSSIVIGDSIWAIKPASIRYHDNVVDVENLSISQAEKHINIGGRVSSLASDTLRAELKDIDISYIMDLVNFHKVDFDGLATGSIYATSLMKKPYADAFLQVRKFTFNAADMGDMSLYGNWGKQERAVLLEADMKGPLPEHRTQVLGTIIPGKGMDDGLNLNIQTNKIDLAFLNKFTKGIFRDLQGRASGRARIFGPFKFVNLEGDMLIDELKVDVMAVGAEYHLAGDSVVLRPDNIWLRGARLYDYLGMPGMSEHTATVDAHFMHSAFKNLRFDVSIDAHNMLGYNFPNQGSMSFYGTVYADAQVHMNGVPGNVTIDVAATPMPGTVINYNTATSGTVAEAEFVTYVDKSEELRVKNNSNLSGEGSNSDSSLSTLHSSLPEGSSDLRINFDINANPNAQIRILMDPRTGDNISLFGNGRLRANYYNKGRFQLFGTYRVEEGNYRMSIRDVIRKDFTFLPDGTIVFGGDAMQAALNLTAKHTVPNVSLDDLSTTGLGLSNTRVDCIMNIGGMAREPVISFDFDIPNANEDEKQMVRSMLSSEEERDMQAIYLLGIGRFYSYGSFIDKKQTQGGMAVNSVLSSALSSRFNQIMSQALGGTGWSFGTNLRTGEEGWQELDAEALVSGKMLSGRLQFNGNFGYRENKYKMGSNNFIGDFDIQYRLSPRSPFSLKAYNQTNDRYFTQSSLTTQGIGIKFQRDFDRFRELFLRTKKKGKKE